MRTKQLGQSRPSDTTAVSIFSPALRDRYEIHNIIVCNTTAISATYRIFLDENGTTYDQTTSLAYDISLPGNTTTLFELKAYMNDPSGNLAVRTGTANAITFTVNGTEGSG